ncbi:MAG: MipA/OmpV family protein [Rhizobacter sp.]
MIRSISSLAAALAVSATAHAQPVAPDNQWSVTLGLGVLSTPEYAGSDNQKVTPVPVLVATNGRWFLGALPATGVPFGIGYNLLQTSQWRFGVAVGSGFAQPREEKDDARLAGLGDIDATAQLAAFGSFTEQWFTARAAVTTDIGGNGHGTYGLVDLEGKYRVNERFAVSIAPGITVADRRNQQTFFGIDASQSARSGRPEYHTEGGLNSVRLAFGAEYRLSPQWGLGARAVVSKLRGDAADSPITQDTTQNTFSLFTTYRF